MTRTIASNQDNDVFLDRLGNIAIATGATAVAMNCRTAIQAQLGEMLFAADKGMPTFETAWNNYNPLQFEAAARVILLGVPDVVAVEAFTVNRAGETLGYTATIRTIYGETPINGRL